MTEIKLFFKYSYETIKRLKQCPSIYKPTSKLEKINKSSNRLPTLKNDATYDPPFHLTHFIFTHFYVSSLKSKKLIEKNDRKLIVNDKDGGTVALDWFKFEKEIPYDAPILLICHSLIGGAGEPYIQLMIEDSYRNGFRPVVMINRGCSGLKMTSDIGYSGCKIDDLELCLNEIKKKYDQSKIFSVGYCFGGSILLNHLLVYGKQSPITAFGCISHALDTGIAFDNLSLPFMHRMTINRIIIPLLLKYHKKFSSEALAKMGCSLDDLNNARTVRRFDELVTSKMFGYGNAQEYYDDVDKPMKHLDLLEKPTLFVNAENDAISPPINLFPFEKAKSNENIICAITKYGGHLAFFRNQDYKQWSNIAILEYFKTF